MQRAVLLCVLLPTLFAPFDLRAQFVSGRVLHASSGQPLDAVNVEIRTTDGRRIAQALSDSLGNFGMQASRTGSYSLVAERIGLASVTSQLHIGSSEEVEVLIRMAEVALTLEPITVEARSRRNIGALAGYYDRVERHQRLGLGNVITRDRIDERNAFRVTDLMRNLPRLEVRSRAGRGGEVRFRGTSGGCTPKVYLDGVLANRGEPAYIDALVSTLDIEGIEVYQGFAQMPAEYHDVTGCGVVLLWTRRGVEGGAPFKLKRFIVAGAIIGLFLLIF